MSKQYEQWEGDQVYRLGHLSSDGIVKIFNDCGAYLERFAVKNLVFDKYYVSDDKLRAVYIADVKSDMDDDWIHCHIIINRDKNGNLEADFGGADPKGGEIV